MNADDFESALKRAGYLDVETKQFKPGLATQPHAHPFDVRALVLDGEITLVANGVSRTYRAGEIFEMAAGCEHAEQYGPAGARNLVGRRHPAA
jgi:quercetin dioxygenase-like cupin family protein